jgi:hypothetical protein
MATHQSEYSAARVQLKSDGKYGPTYVSEQADSLHKEADDVQAALVLILTLLHAAIYTSCLKTYEPTIISATECINEGSCTTCAANRTCILVPLCVLCSRKVPVHAEKSRPNIAAPAS